MRKYFLSILSFYTGARVTILICYFVKLSKNNDRVAEFVNCILCKLLFSVFLTACDVCTNTPVQPYTQFNAILALCSQFPVACRQTKFFQTALRHM